ncbi:MAG: DinB family protein [Terriglobales bacterium]
MPAPDPQAALKRQIVASWSDANVHVTFDMAFGGVPAAARGAKPAGQPFTLWRELEHLRLCARDFLNYCRVPDYIEPPFPAGYWPAADAPPDAAAWEASLVACRNLQQEFAALVLDPATDLLAPLAAGGEPPRTVLRQALAYLDHTGYHLGQALLLRRLLGLGG